MVARMILKWMPPQRMVVTKMIQMSRPPPRKVVTSILKSMHHHDQSIDFRSHHDHCRHLLHLLHLRFQICLEIMSIRTGTSTYPHLLLPVVHINNCCVFVHFPLHTPQRTDYLRLAHYRHGSAWKPSVKLGFSRLRPSKPSRGRLSVQAYIEKIFKKTSSSPTMTTMIQPSLQRQRANTTPHQWSLRHFF